MITVWLLLLFFQGISESMSEPSHSAPPSLPSQPSSFAASRSVSQVDNKPSLWLGKEENELLFSLIGKRRFVSVSIIVTCPSYTYSCRYLSVDIGNSCGKISVINGFITRTEMGSNMCTGCGMFRQRQRRKIVFYPFLWHIQGECHSLHFILTVYTHYTIYLCYDCTGRRKHVYGNKKSTDRLSTRLPNHSFTLFHLANFWLDSSLLIRSKRMSSRILLKRNCSCVSSIVYSGSKLGRKRGSKGVVQLILSLNR